MIRLQTSGSPRPSLEAAIAKLIGSANPNCLGIAVAYVSTYGFLFLRGVTRANNIENVRLIANISDAVTHPQALRLALREGWLVRTYSGPGAILHSKVIICGGSFEHSGAVENPSAFVIGSANLTKGGLLLNVECSIIAEESVGGIDVSEAFREIWSLGRDLDVESLDIYEREFAERNRNRSTEELIALQVGEGTGQPITAVPSIENRVAVASWAGLESFTGEYTFQLEFPRDAGQVLNRILQSPTSYVDVRREDGVVRSMRYRYYPDNAMFRLNIPNDVPGIAFARETKHGIGIISLEDDGQPSLRIVSNDAEVADIMRRSFALGTWGRTQTRYFGWF